jgi:hypothetical protein
MQDTRAREQQQGPALARGSPHCTCTQFARFVLRTAGVSARRARCGLCMDRGSPHTPASFGPHPNENLGAVARTRPWHSTPIALGCLAATGIGPRPGPWLRQRDAEPAPRKHAVPAVRADLHTACGTRAWTGECTRTRAPPRVWLSWMPWPTAVRQTVTCNGLSSVGPPARVSNI